MFSVLYRESCLSFRKCFESNTQFFEEKAVGLANQFLRSVHTQDTTIVSFSSSPAFSFTLIQFAFIEILYNELNGSIRYGCLCYAEHSQNHFVYSTDFILISDDFHILYLILILRAIYRPKTVKYISSPH